MGGGGAVGMEVEAQIEAYIAGQPAGKRDEMRALHRRILGLSPGCRLWFLDGRNDEGKVVTNPNIGYGARTIAYASGEARAFYRVGLSGNTGGLSVYVMGAADRAYLRETYGPRLGKAKVSGYCVKFRSLGDIDVGVLEEMVAEGLGVGLAPSATGSLADDPPPPLRRGRKGA